MQEQLISVEDYFEKLGIRKYKNLLQFWSAIDAEYGLTRARELESVYKRLEAGDEESFYAKIFQSLELSIAFTSLRQDLYRNYLAWLDSFITSEPRLIVDIGCGNGVLSCYLASRYPGAQIIGLDISSEAVSCSIKLAEKLGIENARFLESSAEETAGSLAGEKADLIMSVAVLGPEPASADPEEIPLKSLFEKRSKDSGSRTIAGLSELLADGGNLVSFDKVKDPRAQLNWIMDIVNTGLEVDFGSCAWLTYEDIEAESITLPVLVARKRNGEGEDNQPDFDEILSFLLARDGSDTLLHLEGEQGLLAETLFRLAGPRSFVTGGRADYPDGGGTYWYEIWQTGPFLISFEHTNHGYRALRCSSLLEKTACLEAFHRWVEESRGYSTVSLLEGPDIDFQSESK
ncbi:MAG: class I SAM-dependent methyltransferase [Cyanobacteria bacterium HKST-UBA02]|nr:class I SAM-dependent methyltransferase [Cyanobacteria bacterium HKST-UBA02]